MIDLEVRRIDQLGVADLQRLERQLSPNNKPVVIIIDSDGKIRFGQLEKTVQLCNNGEILSDLVVRTYGDYGGGYLIQSQIQELYLIKPKTI